MGQSRVATMCDPAKQVTVPVAAVFVMSIESVPLPVIFTIAMISPARTAALPMFNADSVPPVT
jgi:hypothetical protein